MKNVSLLLGLSFVLLLSAFKAPNPAEKVNLPAGTYGVYNFNSSQNLTLIELKLNDDFTFRYVNNTDPAKPVSVKGNWKLTGKTIILDNYKSEFPINTNWTIDNNQPCLRSRKGLEFTRLCLIKADK